jgi:hypothetical protein
VAIVEVLAGDRAPQFLRQKYVASIPESMDIGHSVLQLEANTFPPVDEDRPPKANHSLYPAILID